MSWWRASSPLRAFTRLAAVALTLAGPTPLRAAGRPAWTLKVDPGLEPALAATSGDTSGVWVVFADKGEAGPADLAAKLAAAGAALSPRSRARRLRAGVRPLVDEIDLPVHAPYVEALDARGLRPYAASRWLNRVAIRLPSLRLEEVARLPFVARIASIERMRRSIGPELGGLAPPSRPALSAPLARAGAVDYGRTLGPLSQIGVPALHDQGYTGAGVLVAVLDDGFNYFDRHEALSHLTIPPERQRDFVRGLHDVQDLTNGGMLHGTSVLGCLAGRKFGAYVGAAYGAEYALARTEVDQTEMPQEMVYWGMGAEWADSLGADIVSSSLGYFTFDNPSDNYTYGSMDGHTTSVSQAAEIAASRGMLVVNAVGNEGNSAWHYLIAPSDVNGDSVLAVGAVDSSGVPAGFSSFGPSADGRTKPDLAARGVSNPLVAATGDPQAYTQANGTSFATPLVAGLAACLMEARPAWTPRDVSRALRFTASRHAAPDDRVGYGIPDGLQASYWDLGTGTPSGGAALRLELAGPNPVLLGRRAAQFRVGLPAGVECASRAGLLTLHDLAGRRVRQLWSGMLPCGSLVAVAWDGLDQEGHPCRSGVYVADLRSGGDRMHLRVVGIR